MLGTVLIVVMILAASGGLGTLPRWRHSRAGAMARAAGSGWSW